MEFLALFGGLLTWYLLYGAECFINGTIQGGWSMPFREWWRELCWNLPFVGNSYRLAHTCGDQEWANMLPGRIHFFLTCICLPLGPWLLTHLYLRTLP